MYTITSFASAFLFVTIDRHTAKDRLGLKSPHPQVFPKSDPLKKTDSPGNTADFRIVPVEDMR
jgi:hypothetical protein